MKKVLFFEDNRVFFDFEKWPVKGIEIHQTEMFRKDIPGFFVKAFRNMGHIFSKYSLGDWYYSEISYDYLIIQDIYFNINILKNLRGKNKYKKIVLYYRNRIRKIDEKALFYAKKNNFVICTYSELDSSKYNIVFVPQCWNTNIIPQKEFLIKNDIYFLGASKNRYNELMEIKEKAEKIGLICKFQIVSSKPLPNTIQNNVPYLTSLDSILSSKAVLDIVTKDNWGLTIRPLEALMTRRKLITNYSEIKNYDFYDENKSNIFILGENSFEELNKFINTPFVDGGRKIYEYSNEKLIKKLISLE